MNAYNDLLVKAHQDQMYRDASEQRLAHEAEQPNRPNMLLAAVGRQMVKLGEQLVQDNHVQPSRELQPER